ncbi:hypothetical protein HH800_02305 [Sphingobium yanoikuyae]|uniref:Uncharacterized protein n=1 Tax=Sphingobium yanoikuyae TaxID=13690 RepID=A0A6M4GD22_SPHYA|nr:hypothetical protein HH800_02305 [Sphingobium yanoikuyae]
MLDDWELWACAQQVIQQHKSDAPRHVAIRIGELAAAGDTDGVEAWSEIARRVDQLMDYRSGRPLSKQ